MSNIDLGDTVQFCFIGPQEQLTGILKYKPAVAGDVWVVENERGIFYVQTFECMIKFKLTPSEVK